MDPVPFSGQPLKRSHRLVEKLSLPKVLTETIYFFLMLEVTKTIKAKVHSPTNSKWNSLDKLWKEWVNSLDKDKDYQKLREETQLPSYYARSLSWKVGEGDFSPILMDKDSFRIKETGNKHANFFISIRTLNERIWLPLRMWDNHEEILGEAEICDSILIKRNGEFYIHIVVKKEIKVSSYSSVLGVDLGEKVLATSVVLSGQSGSVTSSINSPEFHGKDVRGVRRHYAWLRKRLGEKKLLEEIERISDKESRIVNNRCHEISKRIVEKAERNDSVIVIGNLKGLNGDTGKGKRMNRIVNSMPHGKLTRYIKYKAKWKGIPVVLADESHSSITCHKCGRKGKRPSQGQFKCPSCGTEYNADLNGAINIGKRFLDQWLRDGAVWLSAQEDAKSTNAEVQSVQKAETSTQAQN